MSGILPPEVHTAAAQLEDALTQWRTGTRPHRRTRAAGVRAAELTGDVIDGLLRLRAEIRGQVAEYDAAHSASPDALTDHAEYVEAASRTADRRDVRELDDVIADLDGARDALRDMRGRWTVAG